MLRYGSPMFARVLLSSFTWPIVRGMPLRMRPLGPAEVRTAFVRQSDINERSCHRTNEADFTIELASEAILHSFPSSERRCVCFQILSVGGIERQQFARDCSATQAGRSQIGHSRRSFKFHVPIERPNPWCFSWSLSIPTESCQFAHWLTCLFVSSILRSDVGARLNQSFRVQWS
jgi:hypothetical protein